MDITLLKAKIHRAVVTQADLDYVGSITIDSNLLSESDNGNRFETYAIAGEAGSGVICLNGAAARCVEVGDKIIIMAYAYMTPEEAREHKPTVLFVDEHNKLVRKANYEKHGLLKEQ